MLKEKEDDKYCKNCGTQDNLIWIEDSLDGNFITCKVCNDAFWAKYEEDLKIRQTQVESLEQEYNRKQLAKDLKNYHQGKQLGLFINGKIQPIIWGCTIFLLLLQGLAFASVFFFSSQVMSLLFIYSYGIFHHFFLDRETIDGRDTQ